MGAGICSAWFGCCSLPFVTELVVVSAGFFLTGAAAAAAAAAGLAAAAVVVLIAPVAEARRGLSASPDARLGFSADLADDIATRGEERRGGERDARSQKKRRRELLHGPSQQHSCERASVQMRCDWSLLSVRRCMYRSLEVAPPRPPPPPSPVPPSTSPAAAGASFWALQGEIWLSTRGKTNSRRN